ncbi:hypothetical protein OPQ81_000394 [Rhizoctonia solani]|nr:hypothetical protein OPQ81_000394 [Rhizoctonia solani]
MARKTLEAKTGEPSSGIFIEHTADIISDGETSTDSSGPLIRHPEFCFDNTLIAIRVGASAYWYLDGTDYRSDWKNTVQYPQVPTRQIGVLLG